MKNAWILLIALLGIILTVVYTILSRKKATKKKKTEYKPIANTSSVRELPEYKAAKRQYKILLVSVGLLFVTIFSTVAIIASRPISVNVAKPEYENRDIMLCLDVSGSMRSYVGGLLDYFSNLVKDFQGQRVGITIFDGISATLSPLSDDYDTISDILIDMKEKFDDYSMAVSNTDAPSSQIGPGLVSCVNSFDKLDQERSRAIIFATDNYAFGGQTVNLTQAANYAKRYNIATYGLSTSDYRSQEEVDSADPNKYEWSEIKEFREAMIATGGAYYVFNDRSGNSASAKEIVDQILEQAAVRYEGSETLIEKDSPLIPSIIAIISAILLFVALWRLGL